MAYYYQETKETQDIHLPSSEKVLYFVKSIQIGLSSFLTMITVYNIPQIKTVSVWEEAANKKWHIIWEMIEWF